MSDINEWHETPSSSTIAKFGYDVSTQELVVQFKSGHTYTYADVGQDAYWAMVDLCETEDGSVGKWFSKHIRGVYQFAKSEPKA